MEKKIIKIIAAIGLIIIALGTLVSYSVSLDKNYSQIGTDVLIEDGEALTQGMKFEFTIDSENDYIGHIKWRSKSGRAPEFLTGAVMTDADGNFIMACTGDEVAIDTEELHLKKGTYEVALYTLTSEEAANEFRANYKTGITLGKEFENYSDNTECQMEYFFKISPAVNVVGLIKIILSMILSIAGGLLLSASFTSGKSSSQVYDERQVANRGLAYKYSFYTLLVYCICAATVDLLGVKLPISIGLVMLWGVMVALGVFVTVALWKDCYFALNDKRRNVVIFLSISLVIFIASLINNIKYGFVEFAVVNVSFIVLFIFTLAVIGIKSVIDSKEAE